jgi:hypothetical protein
MAAAAHPGLAHVRVIGENDAAVPTLIDNHLQAPHVRVRAQDCPWVKIGNLYVSVSITGKESWSPLVDQLVHQGYTKFALFSGRHGDYFNYVDSTGEMQNVFETDLFAQDNQKAAEAVAQFPSIKEFKVIDTGQQKTGQTGWLQRMTWCYLRGEAGTGGRGPRAVIYAWCQGIYTMVEVPTSAQGPAAQSFGRLIQTKSVSQLVKEYWSWVPR